MNRLALKVARLSTILSSCCPTIIRLTDRRLFHRLSGGALAQLEGRRRQSPQINDLAGTNASPRFMKDNSYKQALDDLKDEFAYMTPDAREMCRKGFKLTLPNVIAIGSGEDADASAASVIRANDNLGKYGFGHRTVRVADEQFIRMVGRVTCKYITDETQFKQWVKDIGVAIQTEYGS